LGDSVQQIKKMNRGDVIEVSIGGLKVPRHIRPAIIISGPYVLKHVLDGWYYEALVGTEKSILIWANLNLQWHKAHYTLKSDLVLVEHTTRIDEMMSAANKKDE